jgi:hypothetical protein
MSPGPIDQFDSSRMNNLRPSRLTVVEGEIGGIELQIGRPLAASLDFSFCEENEFPGPPDFEQRDLQA